MKAFFFLLSILAAVATAVPTNTGGLKDIRFPNYLVPLNQSQPNTPLGTQYTGTVRWNGGYTRNEITLIVGFDVPTNSARTCFLRFTLPWKSSNTWHVIGTVILDYYGLSRPVNQQYDSWNNRPQRVPQTPLGQIQVYPGQDGVVTGSMPCRLGTRMDFELVAYRPAGAMEVHWFELDDPKTGITLEMY